MLSAPQNHVYADFTESAAQTVNAMTDDLDDVIGDYYNQQTLDDAPNFGGWNRCIPCSSILPFYLTEVSEFRINL